MPGMFCPTCKMMLFPKEGKLTCRKCGFTKDAEDKKITQEVKKSDVADPHEEIKDVGTLPTARVECPECKNKEAYWYMRQTRAADEPTTRFYICTKCRKTWREY
jgi:transcription factor S